MTTNTRRLNETKHLVKLNAHPKLNSPSMVAAWPGIGNVSVIVASYLKEKLPFRRLGELEASYFFNPIGVAVKDNVVEAPQFPQSKFYYWKNRPGRSDLILFIGDDQPNTKGYELANCVLDVGAKFQVKRVYTCAAALTHIHHTEQSRVWGVATTQKVAQDLHRFELTQGGNLQIAGLNGLVLGVARERGIEGVCLLGEVPMYATRLPNPMAALAVLDALTMMLNIKIDMNEIMQVATEARERMKQVVAEAMGEYISYFTEPIWESGQENLDDEDEDADGEEEE